MPHGRKSGPPDPWTPQWCADTFEEETGLAVDVGPLGESQWIINEEGREELVLVGAKRTASVLRVPLAMTMLEDLGNYSWLDADRRALALVERTFKEACRLRKSIRHVDRISIGADTSRWLPFLREITHQLATFVRRERKQLAGRSNKPGRPPEKNFEKGVLALRAIRGTSGKTLTERQIALALVAIGVLTVEDEAEAIQRVSDRLRAASRREKREKLKRRGGKNRP